MRILVVGSYPPPATKDSRRTVATVHRLSAQGDTVDVLSAPGTAARHRGPTAGPLGALRTWSVGRKYEAVVVHIEDGAPLRTVHGRRARIDRLVDCFSWGVALRLLRDVTLVVPDTAVVHRSVGGRTGRFLWTGARRLLVSNEHDRRRLIDEGGASESRVELAAITVAVERRSDDGWDGLADADAIMDRIRRRAAEDRRAARRGTLDAGV